MRIMANMFRQKYLDRAFLIVFGLFVSGLLVSEDVEIYKTTIGADEEAEYYPNLLFVIDTSNSMANTTAVLLTDPYDPDTTYNESEDGTKPENYDYVYVYDELGGYTGAYFTAEQNKCNAAAEKFELTPETPIHTDRGVYWSETQVCSNQEQSGEAYTYTTTGSGSLVNNIKRTLVRTEKDEYSEDTVVTVTVENLHPSKMIYFKLQTRWPELDLAGEFPWIDVSGVCENIAVEGGGSNTCTYQYSDIPPGDWEATRIRVHLHTTVDYLEERDFQGEVTLSGTYDCVDPTSSTQWNNNFTSLAVGSEALECQDDRGLHGINSSSSEIYVKPCEGASCSAPSYSGLSSSELEWSAYDFYQFVPGNYHNYRQQDQDLLADIVYTETDDPFDYCNSRKDNDDDQSKRSGEYVKDTVNDLYYQCQTYIEIATKAAIDVVSEQSSVNVGLMRFNGMNGGIIINAVEDVSTNLDTFTAKTLSLFNEDAGNDTVKIKEPLALGTPLGESLYEAYLYFAGKEAYYGAGNDDGEVNSDGDVSDDFLSEQDTGAFSGSLYKSPIENSCQSNNIIFLSDGRPAQDKASETRISSISDIGASCNSDLDPDYNCLDQLSGYMAGQTVNSDFPGSTVNSFYIGFNQNIDLFEAAGEASKKQSGVGGYYQASSYDDLLTAFRSTFTEIAVDTPTTLVAPAVSVNAFNELQHRDQIYYAIFEPSLTTRWQGNVKKYTINGDAEILDQTGEVAVDETTGFFKETARSYWSDVEDGAEVTKGGFAEQLEGERTLYLDAAAISGETGTGITKFTSSSSLAPSALGLTDADSDEINKISQWLLGYDVKDEDVDGLVDDPHFFVADSLHSRPFVITYGGSTENDAEDILFVSNNLGMVHAVNAGSDTVDNEAGHELWAYMPEELMGNAKEYFDNRVKASGEKNIYGLDAEATVWTEQDTSSSSGYKLSQVYMYQGMRRGGRGYFAWDITKANSKTEVPISTMWTIPGTNTTDFNDLGQTWSKMIRTKISWNCDEYCETRDVLVFSGGYDEYYDNEENMPKTDSSDLKGNAVYIVDAEDGWNSAVDGNNDGQRTGFVYKIGNGSSYDLSLPIYNSIPADPNPIDIDGDGAMDILFFVDIAGHIWRVDFNQSLDIGADSYTSGGMIADLYDGVNFRRFYNGLDVSFTAPPGQKSYYNLVVGSGYRAHPKDEEVWANAMYVVYDENIAEPLLDVDSGQPIYEYMIGEDGSRSVVELDDLHAWSSDKPADRQSNATYGYYRSLDLEENEKILQTSITFNSRVLFSSYLPTGESSNSCGSGIVGSGRTYVLDLSTGNGVFDTNDDGIIDGNDDATVDLANEGIPADGTILVQDDGLITCFGTECRDDLLNLTPGQAIKTYWRED